jgi:hypothetical protein
VCDDSLIRPESGLDVLQQVCGRHSQSPLDLGQVRVGDAHQRGELPQRNGRQLPLLPDELADQMTEAADRVRTGNEKLNELTRTIGNAYLDAFDVAAKAQIEFFTELTSTFTTSARKALK